MGRSQGPEGEMTGQEAGGGGQGAPGTLERSPTLEGTLARRVIEAQSGALNRLSNSSPSFSQGGKADLSAYALDFLPTPPCDEQGSHHIPLHRSATQGLRALSKWPKATQLLDDRAWSKETQPRSPVGWLGWLRWLRVKGAMAAGAALGTIVTILSQPRVPLSAPRGVCARSCLPFLGAGKRCPRGPG